MGPTAATREGLSGVICVAAFTAAAVKLSTGARAVGRPRRLRTFPSDLTNEAPLLKTPGSSGGGAAAGGREAEDAEQSWAGVLSEPPPPWKRRPRSQQPGTPARSPGPAAPGNDLFSQYFEFPAQNTRPEIIHRLLLQRRRFSEASPHPPVPSAAAAAPSEADGAARGRRGGGESPTLPPAPPPLSPARCLPTCSPPPGLPQRRASPHLPFFGLQACPFRQGNITSRKA